MGVYGALIAALVVLLYGAVSQAQSCVGDCPPINLQVSINELVLGVNIALGKSTLASCPSYDDDGSDDVGVAELVSAVNNALKGCSGAPTPTPRSSAATATATPSRTAAGPPIVFFGVTSADDSLQPVTGTGPNGVPIYERAIGSGFSLVVEAVGNINLDPPPSTYEPGGTPSLQIQATRDLGDGSPAVCDAMLPNFGGVPGIDPPQLDDPNAIADALNDFGCRFVDGVGTPQGRACSQACIRSDDGEYRCKENAVVEFCAPIPVPMAFAAGDTLVTARVRDDSGQLGPPAQVIIRITPP
jgi:hypothetical protein